MKLKIVALAISVEFPCCESRANGGRYLFLKNPEFKNLTLRFLLIARLILILKGCT